MYRQKEPATLIRMVGQAVFGGDLGNGASPPPDAS
jgi:hypothetical protein